MSRRAALAFLGGGQSASFVALNTAAASGSSTTLSFSGMAAGNLAVMYIQGTANTPDPVTGWTVIVSADWANGFHQKIYWKVLDAADILAGSVTVTHADNHGIIMAYSGASSVAARSFTESGTTATTLALPGFTLAANTAGVLIFVEDAFGSTGFSPPTAGGLTNRLAPVAITALIASAWDFLIPGDYPEQTLTFTGFDATAEQIGHVLELLL